MNTLNIAIQIAGKAMSRSSAWVIVIDSENRILLGKRSQKVSNGGQWGLFGGTIDDGENPANGAARELHEEIGLRAKPRKLRFLWRNEHPGDKRHSYYYRLNMNGKGRPKVKINWETEKAKWFSLKDARKLSSKHFTLVDMLNKAEAAKKLFKRKK